MPRVLWVALIGLVVLLADSIPRLMASDWEGLPVQQVRHQPEESQQQAIDPAVLGEMLPQKAGEPYSSQKIRESIERLFATGRFTDVRVDAVREDGGAVLTFLTKSAYFIGAVKFRGVAAPPTVRQLHSASHFELGHLFSEEAVSEAIEGLRRLLEEDGYFEARIAPSYETHPDTQQIDVTFDIHTGKRARFGEVVVTGSPVFPAARLLKQAKWKRGKSFTASLVQNGLGRIQKLYQQGDYLDASVEITQRRFRPEGNLADLELAIAAGTQVKVSVTGVSMSRSQIKKLVPIFEEGSLDEELLEEGRRNLGDYFQSQGYFEVKVSTQRKNPSPARSSIEYQVDRGPRQSLKEIRIAGNSYFSAETLREHMKIKPASMPSSYGHFNPKLLAQDLDAIRALYQTNGFADVEVTSAPETSGGVPERHLTVSIQIREGSQTRIGNFTITGYRSFSQDRVESNVNARKGQPYSQSLVTADRDNLLTFYFNQGFPEAKFQERVARSEDPEHVDLQYVLDEGPREYVGNIYVDGLKHTRPGVVDRELQLRDGQPLGQAGLLGTQRHLYDLGIFSQVEVAIQNPNGRESRKNVLIDVEEARRYTMKLGLGAEVARFGRSSVPTNVQGTNAFSPDFSLEITRLNVWGRPHTVSFISRFSTLQKRAGISYTAPRFLNHEGWEASVRTFYDETFNVLTFTARRVEGSVQFQDKISRTTALFYRYTLSRVTVDTDTLRISPALFPILARPVLVGMVSQTTIRDTRDNPTDSHQGMFTSADLGIAAKQTGSQASFVKMLFRNSSYYRLGKRLVLARSSQFGVQTAMGAGRRVVIQQAAGGQPAQEIYTNEIPIAEHFFSGGGNSHRGFAVNQAGPRDPATGFPLGGNALLLNSVELRFPIWGENIGGVLFHDMGNVFAHIGDFSLRQNQKDPQDFNYISHAVGFGLRYRTPVGPIRLDLGYNLNPTRFLIQTGSSVTGQSLTRWQFLFSIGQNF